MRHGRDVVWEIGKDQDSHVQLKANGKNQSKRGEHHDNLIGRCDERGGHHACRCSRCHP